MPDYATWALADALTVEQAACLWAGADPTGNSFRRPPEETERIAAIRQMLTAAIQNGELAGDSSANVFRHIGDHSKTLVRREALHAFAEKKGQRPAFLFERSASNDDGTKDQAVVDAEAVGFHADNTKEKKGNLAPERAEPSTTPDRFRTGFPGRPPHMKHLIEQEFQRRRETGEVCEPLAEEARVLLDWAAKKHPDAPQPTAKTITSFRP